MKATKEMKQKNVGTGLVSAQKGITLIALVITIVVMLILVSVTISMAVNGGLFEYAGNAVSDTRNEIRKEQELASGKVQIDGLWYDSIDDYINNKPIQQSIKIEGTLEGALNLKIESDYDATTAPVTGQLTATLKEIEGTVTWTSDNEEVAKVSNTGLVTAIAAGTAKITASVTQEGVTRKDECTVTVETKMATITTADSYVGRYADLDGNPNTVEGIIYADLAAGVNVDYLGVNFTKAAETTGLKEYTISKRAHVGTFGKDGTEVRDVISVVEDPTGQLQDRFYVMALTDVTTNDYTTFYWYKNAYGKMTASDTAVEFETGKANTEKIKGIWELNASTPYGTQDPRDLWAQIDSNSNRTWFVPSKGEWAAFADAFDITTSNYSSTYGLSYYYWSSSQRSANNAWYVRFANGTFNYYDVGYDNCVRLSATF